MRIIAFIEDEEVIKKILKQSWTLGGEGPTSAQGERALRNDLPQ
jgi:hypothetical protein